jgi:predicted esterase
MPELKALEEAVAALDPTALAEFRRWFAEFDAFSWDRQLEADLTAGKLDALLTEAEDDYRSQPRRSL